MFRLTDQHKESSEEMFGIKWIKFTPLSTGVVKQSFCFNCFVLYYILLNKYNSTGNRVDAYNQ